MRLVLSIAVVIVALMVSNITPASAGGGHLHGYSGGRDDGGEEPVVLLGNDAIANLAIKTIKVSAAPPIGARLSGVIERLPDGIVTVSAPTGGAITKVSTRPGESVKRGQAVAFFSPFQVGAGAFPLLAPIDGVVASIGAPLGAGREAGTVLFTVIDAQRVGLVAPVIGSDRVNLKVGDSVPVLVRGDPQPFQGRIYLIEQGGADLSVVGRIVVELLPREGALPTLGAVGSLTRPGEGAARVFPLPREAVVGNVIKPVVFVRRGNRFVRRDVVVARDLGEIIEIERGLAEGEPVVVKGAYQLNLARSDSPEKLTVGPHEGVVTTCSSTNAPSFFAEIKLHDDKGDIEIWLGKTADFKDSHSIPPTAKVALGFSEHGRSVDLAVRDLRSNLDEDGTTRLKDGVTDYFIFPGETASDARWLQGGEFIDEVVLTVTHSGGSRVCEVVTLIPHSHGAAAHSHGEAEDSHEHAHDDHGHSHDHSHDHGGAHSH